jgi:hypothetical protein
MPERTRTVATFNSLAEAEMARGRLEAEGILAVVLRDDAGGMFPQFQTVRGVKLDVAPQDLAAARTVLGLREGMAEETDDDWDDERDGDLDDDLDDELDEESDEGTE